ncbi:hypothetical protein HY994_01390 [Candidatus Micrarchaeota archaeon]|nr:hypothetical protein [Candidatus Micrarchaeota archaeon]
MVVDNSEKSQKSQWHRITVGLFALMVISLLLAGLAVAVSGYSVSSAQSVTGIASNSIDGGSSHSSSTVEVNGDAVSSSDVSSSGSGSSSSGVSVSSSSASGGSSTDLDALVRSHFTALDKIVTDMTYFGVSVTLQNEAAATLQSEKTQWVQAVSADEKMRMVDSMNAYWADFRQRLRATGAAYDFDAQLALSDVDGVSTAVSASGSVGVTGGVGAPGSNGVQPSAMASLGVVNNVVTHTDPTHAQSASSSSSASGAAQSGGFLDGFANGIGSVTASIGVAIGGFFSAVGRLFG